MTWQTKTDALAPHAGGVSLSRLSGLPEWLRSNLFPQADRGRLTWRHILAGVLFVAAGAAVSLTRTSGPGALNSTWIEDAGNFLQDGLNHSVATTLSTQMNGYYDVVPRAITAVAVAFPVAWAPGIMSAAAAAEYALFGLIVYIASGPFLRNPWLRLLVAVPAFVVPRRLHAGEQRPRHRPVHRALRALLAAALAAGDTGGPGMRPTHHARHHADQHPACLLRALVGGAADSRPVEDRDRRRRVLGGGPARAVERPVARDEQPDERLVHQPAVDPR